MKLTNLIPIKAGKTLSRLCIIGALSLGSSFVFAQNQQVRLSGNNLTLKAAFKQIEQQNETLRRLQHARCQRFTRDQESTSRRQRQECPGTIAGRHELFRHIQQRPCNHFQKSPGIFRKQKKSQVLSKMKKENRSSARMLWRRGRRMVLLPI